MSNYTFILQQIMLFCIIIFVLGGLRSKQKDKYYIRLFNPKEYKKHIIFSILLAIAATVELIFYKQMNYCFLFIHLFYLLFFKLANKISHKLNKRNIIIAMRNDEFPKEHNYIDTILSFLLPIVSILIPVFLESYLLDKFIK